MLRLHWRALQGELDGSHTQEQKITKKMFGRLQVLALGCVFVTADNGTDFRVHTVREPRKKSELITEKCIWETSKKKEDLFYM